VPDNLVYRQALRGVERRKFSNDPGKVGMLVGAKNQPILFRAKNARSKQRFAEAIELCEDAFVNNPWDVGAARVSAEAAEGLGLRGVAQWLVESVLAVTKDVDFSSTRPASSRITRAGPRPSAAGRRSSSSIPTIKTQPPDQRSLGQLDHQAGQAR